MPPWVHPTVHSATGVMTEHVRGGDDHGPGAQIEPFTRQPLRLQYPSWTHYSQSDPIIIASLRQSGQER